MTFLGFLLKFYTRIIVLIISITAIVFSVYKYSNDYHETLFEIKNTETVDKAKIKITTYPAYEKERVSFDGKITAAGQKELCGINVTVYFSGDNPPCLMPGDTVEVTGDRQSPSPQANLGGFDGESYCKSENNHGNIYADKLKLLHKNTNSFVLALCRLRTSFTAKVDNAFSPEYAGVVKALITGDKSSVYDSDAEALKKSGVYHIVAISGMHLNIFIIIFSNFIASLKLKRLKKSLLAFAVCSLVGIFVLLFTGFGLSVIRAFVMLVISLLSSVFARRYSSKNALAISAVIIMLLIPSSFFNIGFRLSVLSTYGVLLSADAVKKLKEKQRLKKLASASFTGVFITSALCVGLTLPVTAESFGYISVYSWLANFVILPLMAPVLGGCVVFGIVSLLGLDALSKVISYPVNLLIRFILKAAKLVSDLPCSTINIYPLYTFITLVFLLGIVICGYLVFKSKRIPALFMGVILCVAQAGFFMYNNNRTDARVVFADVKQGDCAIVSMPKNKSVMFDFGTNSNIYYSVSDIKATLRKLNIPKLSAVFVSHFHSDHTAGITELVEEGLANKVYVPAFYDFDDEESTFNRRQLLAVCQKTNTPVVKIKSGDKITLGDACMNVFTPTDKMSLGANDMSAVIKLSYGDTSLLFTGDISAKGVKELYDYDIECDIIKVAHHGGKNSADSTFIKKAAPEYAVISCSNTNSYGHPHHKTLDLLTQSGAEIYRTDKMGAIIFDFDKTKIKSVKTMR